MIADIEADFPPSALEKHQTPRLPVTTDANEYASPIFVKRSRASYGPLFELFDEELEDDGGRRGKGRKKPRYSVERGRWRYREESSSPEPETSPRALLDAEQSKPSATEQVTPSKPAMTDGGCQTNDFELPPPPNSSSFNTPLKRWGDSENSPLFAVGLAHAAAASRMDMGVQASPSIPTAPFTETAATASDARSTLGMAASYPGLFGTPQQTGYSLSSVESSFPTVQTPTPSALSQPVNTGNPFGSGSSVSVGFKFGQPPPSPTFNAPLFARSQVSDQPYEENPYPESYLPHDELTDPALTTKHNPFGTEARSHSYIHPDTEKASEFNAQESNTSPYWTTANSSGPIEHPGQLVPVDEGRSHASMNEDTPPGTIRPHVEDGTRNQDEMKHEGLLSRPLFRQGLPKEALPDEEDAFAGEEDESMVSDDRADYDEEEKGDDYDLRNYGGVSDDEDGYDNEEDPPSGEELGEDDEEQYGNEDEECEEGDEEYEEEEDEDNRPTPCPQASRFVAQQLQPTPSKAPKGPVVIDLLSDSDDDEPPAPQPTRSQSQRPPSTNALSSEPIAKEHKNQLTTTSEPEYESSDAEKSDTEEDTATDGLHGHMEESGAEEEFDEDDEFSEEDIHGLRDVEDEPEGDDEVEDNSPVEKTRVTAASTSVVSSDDPIAPSSPENRSNSNISRKDVDVGTTYTAQRTSYIMEEQIPAEELHESTVESFQTQPAEMLASFQTQTSEAVRSSDARLDDVEDDTNETEAWTDENEAARLGDNQTPHGMNQSKDASEEEMPKEDVPEIDKSQDTTQQNGTQEVHTEVEVDDGYENFENEAVLETDASVKDTTLQQPAEEMELDAEGAENDSMDPESARSAERQSDANKSLIDSSNQEQDVPPPRSTMQHDATNAMAEFVSTTTTTTSHMEMQRSDSQRIIIETHNTELVCSQPATAGEDPVIVMEGEHIEMVDTGRPSRAQITSSHGASSFNEDINMADAEAYAESEDNMENHDEKLLLSSQVEDVAEVLAEPQDMNASNQQGNASPTPNENESEGGRESMPTTGHDLKSTGSSQQQAQPHGHKASQSPEPVPTQLDGAHDDEEEFHDVSEIPDAESFSPIIPYDDHSSFMTANSEASEVHDSEGTEPTSTAKRKRGRKRNDLSINFKRTPRPADLSPSSQRTTRSKAMMTFQKVASPSNNKEDMSILLARAAMKSPTTRKVSSKSNSRAKSTLLKRLADEMPECVPLKDLKKYNNRNLDVAVVAASSLSPPKRTPVREYVSSLSVTDPSVAPDGIIEVTIFSSHREHFPAAKVGDSILLRSFTVKALPEKGWGLKADKDLSSWAVFETNGDDTPQMKAAPVELNDDEQKYMVDLRSWYGSLDEGAKDKLGTAVGALIDKGRERRGEK